MSVADHYVLTPHITGYDSEEYNAVLEEVYLEKTITNRSAKLHEAEAILMEDMPVIPVVFNKTAFVINEELKLHNKVLFKTDSNYYSTVSLKKISVNDYEGYLATCASFLESKYDEYHANPLSYFGGEAFLGMTWDQFKEESSNYAYLFKPIITEETKEKDKKK
jgi:hypothetical protein